MNAKTYGTLVRVIAVLLALLIAVGIVREWPLYVPLIAIMSALVIANVARRSVKEIMADERSRRIDEQAASWTYRVYCIVLAAAVLVALMLRNSLPPWVEIAAQTLAYSVCGLMIVHLAASAYYRSRS